ADCSLTGIACPVGLRKLVCSVRPRVVWPCPLTSKTINSNCPCAGAPPKPAGLSICTVNMPACALNCGSEEAPPERINPPSRTALISRTLGSYVRETVADEISASPLMIMITINCCPFVAIGDEGRTVTLIGPWFFVGGGVASSSSSSSSGCFLAATPATPVTGGALVRGLAPVSPDVAIVGTVAGWGCNDVATITTPVTGLVTV